MDERITKGVSSVFGTDASIRVGTLESGDRIIMVNDGDSAAIVDLTDEAREALIAALTR